MQRIILGIIFKRKNEIQEFFPAAYFGLLGIVYKSNRINWRTFYTQIEHIILINGKNRSTRFETVYFLWV